MSRRFRSLQAQLLLWALLPILFFLVGLALTGVYAHQREMREFVARRNHSLARLTARLIADGLTQGTVGADGSGLAEVLAAVEPPTSAAVVDETGRVLAGSPMTDEMLVVSAPVGGSGWTVEVGEPVAGILSPILRLSGLAPIVAVGAGVVSLLVLALGYGQIVRPLRRLAQAAGQVSWGDYSAIAVAVGGVQEVRDLHRALREMVERIQGYQSGMRDYLGAVTQGQEAERARLARELHDGPVQELIGLGQRAEIARRLVERGDTEEARSLLGELRRVGLATVDELRRIIGALRPVYLEDLGFLPALEMLVRQSDRRTPARVTLELVDEVPRCAPEIELATYRIVQEALRNAIQHAQAEQIEIQVRCAEGNLVVSVEDDGVGFALPLRPDVLTQAGHFGLVGMQERAMRLGGRLQVERRPQGGTRVLVTLPLTLPPS